MTTLTQPKPEDRSAAERVWRARVDVRVPRNDGTGLLADATRRLETAQFERVDVRELGGLQPALSATIAHLDVRLTAETERDRAAIEQRLEDAPGIEAIEVLEPAVEASGTIEHDSNGEPIGEEGTAESG